MPTTHLLLGHSSWCPGRRGRQRDPRTASPYGISEPWWVRGDAWLSFVGGHLQQAAISSSQSVGGALIQVSTCIFEQSCKLQHNRNTLSLHAQKMRNNVTVVNSYQFLRRHMKINDIVFHCHARCNCQECTTIFTMTPYFLTASNHTHLEKGFPLFLPVICV